MKEKIVLHTLKLPSIHDSFSALDLQVDIVRLLLVLGIHADNKSLAIDFLWIRELIPSELASRYLGDDKLDWGGNNTEVSTRVSTRATEAQVLATSSLGLECDLAVLLVPQAPDLRFGLFSGIDLNTAFPGIGFGGEETVGSRNGNLAIKDSVVTIGKDLGKGSLDNGKESDKGKDVTHGCKFDVVLR